VDFVIVLANLSCFWACWIAPVWRGVNFDIVRATFTAPLTQPSCDFEPVGSLSLWRGANYDIVVGTFSAFCDPRLVVLAEKGGALPQKFS